MMGDEEQCSDMKEESRYAKKDQGEDADIMKTEFVSLRRKLTPFIGKIWCCGPLSSGVTAVGLTYCVAVTLSLLSPAGDLFSSESLQMRGAALSSQSWDTRRPSNSSTTRFSYQLDRRAPTGLWSVLLSTELASHRNSVRVLTYSPARLEVRVITPASV